MTPPYRIETERLVIRCYDPEDAPLLKEAVDSSIDHLRPWMPWARNEPQTLDEKVQLLRAFRSQFDADENYPYGIFTPDESRQLGGAGLHPRGGEGSLEIGYFIRVDVQVDPENERSIRIPRKLGFTEEARLRRRLEPKEEGGPRRDSILFTMLAEELPASPCMAYEYVAYDVLGREL